MANQRLDSEQCLGMLHGPSGGGRSFILIDMMLHLAAGKAMAEQSTKKAALYYLAGEETTECIKVAA